MSPAVQVVWSTGTIGMTYAHQHRRKHQRSHELGCLRCHELYGPRPHGLWGNGLLVVRNSSGWGWCQNLAMNGLAMLQLGQNRRRQTRYMMHLGTTTGERDGECHLGTKDGL